MCRSSAVRARSQVASQVSVSFFLQCRASELHCCAMVLRMTRRITQRMKNSSLLFFWLVVCGLSIGMSIVQCAVCSVPALAYRSSFQSFRQGGMEVVWGCLNLTSYQHYLTTHGAARTSPTDVLKVILDWERIDDSYILLAVAESLALEPQKFHRISVAEQLCAPR